MANLRQLTHVYTLQQLKQNYCSLCLSASRQFAKHAFITANEIMYKFPKFISVSPSEDRICWECCATLRKVIGFHHRSVKAKVNFIKAASFNNTTLESLSSLKRTAITVIDIAPITDETAEDNTSVQISINKPQGDGKKPVIVRSKENGTYIHKFIIENAMPLYVMKEDDDKNSSQSQVNENKSNIGYYAKTAPNACSFPKMPARINRSTQTNTFEELKLMHSRNHENLPIRIGKVVPISPNVYHNLGTAKQVQTIQELAFSSDSEEIKIENELETCEASPDASNDPLSEARPSTDSYPELSMNYDEYDDEIEKNYKPGDPLQMKICLQLCYKKIEFLSSDTEMVNKMKSPLRRLTIMKYLEKHYTSTYVNIKFLEEMGSSASAFSMPKNIARVYLREIPKPPKERSLSADHNYYSNENEDYQNTKSDAEDFENAIPTSTVIPSSCIPIMDLRHVDLDKFETKNVTPGKFEAEKVIPDKFEAEKVIQYKFEVEKVIPDKFEAEKVIPVLDLMHIQVNRFGIPTNMSFPFEKKLNRKRRVRPLSKLNTQAIRIYNDVLPSEISHEEMLKLREIDRKNPSYVNAKFKCEKCIFGYDEEYNYKAHVRRHLDDYGPELCNVCELRFKTLEQLEEHKKMHSIAFYCTRCRFGSRFVKSVAAHNQLEHKKPGPFPCKQCDSSYSKDYELQRHIRYAHKAIPTCDVCSKQFKWEYSLKTHMICHEPRGRKPCPVCDRLIYVNNMARHMKRVHNPSSTPKDKSEVDLENMSTPFFCVECQKFFNSQVNLDNHMQGPRHNPTMDFECDHCHKMFHRKSDVRMHIKFMHLPSVMYPCSVCGKSFKKRNVRKNHEDNIHFGKMKKTHMCNVCGKAFHTSTLLRKHLMIHTGERPFQCELCPWKFTQKSTLYTHCRLKHKGEVGKGRGAK